MHARFDACCRALGNAQELDAIAKAGCRFDIGRGDGLDAFDVKLVERDARLNARVVSKDSLWAASKPPMSNAGSASA